MTIALADKWIWDSWYVRDGDVWHAYFLQADKTLGNPDLRHWHVSIGHATSRDLVSWRHLGTCFAPSAEPAFDDYTTWTGSTLCGDDGQWHMFYTGTSHAEGGLVQRIGHAVSDDLATWRRVGDGPALDLGPDPDGAAAALGYEAAKSPAWHDRAMRDPWVMRDPGGDGWLMYFTARVAGHDEANAGGAIGLATSPDLFAWTLKPPVHAGGEFGELEVPQVFRVGERWYCLFCTPETRWARATIARFDGGPVGGTHYLTADDPRGPWHMAPAPFLDGANPCRRFAARIVPTDAGLQLLGFMVRPEGGDFVGEISDPVAVSVADDGRLTLGKD